jgi:hypothetical protein
MNKYFVSGKDKKEFDANYFVENNTPSSEPMTYVTKVGDVTFYIPQDRFSYYMVSSTQFIKKEYNVK